MPFAKAEVILEDMLGVSTSEVTVRRCTERYGSLYEAEQTAAVLDIEEQLPQPPPGPEKQLLSLDGAMVSVLHGDWVEVKTLVVGEIAEPVWEKDGWVVHSTDHSYFSRVVDADSFQRLALVETQRRGVETAQRVIAPADGAVWIQGFLDYHRRDAVRILDFGHAAEYVARIGSVVGAPESPAFTTWLTTSLDTLKHAGATALLPELRAQVTAHSDQPELSEALAYLEKRETMMDYPTYQQQGWPIGSGSVESANKSVVEARLKGAGMHWARENLNPMLSLRNAVCSDRWHEAWQAIMTRFQSERQQRYCDRAQSHAVVALPEPVWEAPMAEVASEAVEVTPPPKERWRPAPDHPWRRSLGPRP